MAKTHEPREIDQALATELRAASSAANVNMAEVSRRLGWHVSKTYTKFRGEQACYLHDVVDMAHAMGYPAWVLLKAAEERAGTTPEDATTAPRHCHYCGDPLPADAHHKRDYCNDECKRRSRLKGAEADRWCMHCGGKIPADADGRAKYCKDQCYKDAAVARRREARARARAT